MDEKLGFAVRSDGTVDLNKLDHVLSGHSPDNYRDGSDRPYTDFGLSGVVVAVNPHNPDQILVRGDRDNYREIGWCNYRVQAGQPFTMTRKRVTWGPDGGWSWGKAVTFTVTPEIRDRILREGHEADHVWGYPAMTLAELGIIEKK